MTLYIIISVVVALIFIAAIQSTGNSDVLGCMAVGAVAGFMIFILWSVMYPFKTEFVLTETHELQIVHSVKTGEPLGHAVMSDKRIIVSYQKEGVTEVDTLPVEAADVRMKSNKPIIEVYEDTAINKTWIAEQLMGPFDLRSNKYKLYIPEEQIRIADFKL